MKSIWKFRLAITDTQSLMIPKGAEVLTAQFQGSDLCFWAVVNPANSTSERIFEIFGTGNPFPTDMGVERKFIATVQQPDLPLVWHVFERL